MIRKNVALMKNQKKTTNQDNLKLGFVLIVKTSPPPPPPTSSDPKECGKCGKRFMTEAIAEMHKDKCNSGQLNTSHNMPLRTPKGPGIIMTAVDKDEMKEIYHALIADPSRVPQDFPKFKAHVKSVFKTEVSQLLTHPNK